MAALRRLPGGGGSPQHGTRWVGAADLLEGWVTALGVSWLAHDVFMYVLWAVQSGKAPVALRAWKSHALCASVYMCFWVVQSVILHRVHLQLVEGSCDTMFARVSVRDEVNTCLGCAGHEAVTGRVCPLAGGC